MSTENKKELKGRFYKLPEEAIKLVQKEHDLTGKRKDKIIEECIIGQLKKGKDADSD